jgi:hypothetical protein
MLVQLQKEIGALLQKNNVSESNVEKVLSEITIFVENVEKLITSAKVGKITVLELLSKIAIEIINNIIKFKINFSSLTNDEVVELSGKVFTLVYNNYIVPIDLPIPDYLEVFVERIAEPLLLVLVKEVVRVILNYVGKNS